MALITCPECGREISDRASACPNCGFPMTEYHQQASKDKQTAAPEPEQEPQDDDKTESEPWVEWESVTDGSTRICRNCWKAVYLTLPNCPHCGAPMTEQPRRKKFPDSNVVIPSLIVLAFLALIIFGAVKSSSSSAYTPKNTSTAYSTLKTSPAPTTRITYPSTKSTTTYTSNATMGEKNALATAKEYLSVMAFSKSGLIDQLEYEGYSTSEAKYGADNCGANWNTQAALMAQQYLDVMSFSRSGLIDQLLYEGFTQEQAEYGVNAVGY